MTLEGRIIGVRMTKSSNVEYMFQPEGIVEIESKEEFPPRFMIKRDKNKRYPLLCFASPFKDKDNANVSEAFSLGYLLIERKELIQIGCSKVTENSEDTFNAEVDSVSAGYGFPKEAK